MNPLCETYIAVDLGNSGWKGARFSTENNAGLASAEPMLPHPLQEVARITGRVASSKETLPFRAPSHWITQEDADRWIDRLSERLPAKVRWWVSSVSAPASDLLRATLNRLRPADDLRWIVHGQVPMKSNLEYRERLGIDRLLAAQGAWVHQDGKGPLVVVQVGTAITIDLVDSAGVFQGGSILPGLAMALRWMSLGTDKLPMLDPPSDVSRLRIPGKNTEQAMGTGVAGMAIGGIQWFHREYARLSRVDSLPLIVSGGDGAQLVPWLGPQAVWVDHLVLRSIGWLGQK